MSEENKSDYADLLNRLSQMQEAYCYAAIKHTLHEAEMLIVSLEAQCKQAMERARNTHEEQR